MAKAKLTESNVREIKRLEGRKTHQEIANEYGVSRSAIQLILAGKSWKHVA